MNGLRWFFIFLLMFFAWPVHAQQEEQTLTSGQNLHQRQQERQTQIETLVEWFEEQQAYLKYLENMQGTIEKELSIIGLMYACRQKGAECTGRGIVMGAAPPADPPQQSSSFAAAAEQQKTADAEGKSGKPSLDLPMVVAVYGDTALVEYRGRQWHLRQGDRLAHYRVRTIDLDRFELESAQGLVRLPVYWPLMPLAADAEEHF